MKPEISATGVLAIAGLAVAGFAAWRLSRAGSDAVQAVGAWVDQKQADVAQLLGNAFSAPAEQTIQAARYSDYAYTGIDPATGRSVLDGEWYGDAEARRYQAEQHASGTAPAATSIDGAAFGVYAPAGKRDPAKRSRSLEDVVSGWWSDLTN